jgi:hypothetical protein
MRRAERHALRRERRSSPEWMLFNTIWSGLFVILLGGLLIIRGLVMLLAWNNQEAGLIIGGLVTLVIGAADLAVSLGGWTQYIWIAIIVVGGFLVILVGLLTYLFKK